MHGAPGCFLEVGDEASEPEPDGKPRFSKGGYTLGKMVWGKVRQHEEHGRNQLLISFFAAECPEPDGNKAFGAGHN